jgi:hypothetical protein
MQAAAEEAREDARALAAQLQTEEGLRASLASQLEARWQTSQAAQMDHMVPS